MPSGTAGGALAGSYPNPTVAVGAIGTNELANLAVTAGKIANTTITNAQIAVGAAIVYAKLSLTNSIQGTDIVAQAVTLDRTTASMDNFVPNGGFEFGATEWSMASGWAISTLAPRGGANHARGTAVSIIGMANKIQMGEGVPVYAEVYAKRNGGTNAGTTARINIEWYGPSGGISTSHGVTTQLTTSYAKLTVGGSGANVVAPATTSFCYIDFEVITKDATSIDIDDVYAKRVINSDLLLDAAVSNVHIATGAAIIFAKLATAAVMGSGQTLASLGTGLTAAWTIGADGTFLLPRLTVAQRLSGVKAQVQLNEDTGEVESYNGRWFAPIASHSHGTGRTFDYYNDFIAVINQNDFSVYANNGGTVAASVSSTSINALHPGVLRMDTGTTSNATGNAGIRVACDTSGTNAQIVLGNGVLRFGVLIHFTVITTPFFNFRAGVVDTGFQSDATVGFEFRYNPNVNSNKFQRSIAGTFVDTGAAAVVAGTWYLLEIVVAADAKSAEFFINGVSVGTSSSATAQSTAVLYAGCGIDKDTSSATKRILDVDLLYIEGEMTADRFG